MISQDPRPIITITLIALLSQAAFAQEASLTPSELKKMTVEELMNIEVTSVSRRPEKLTEAPSAIQVITQEDIHRSGVTSIPEALRLALNLHVAQKNSHDWAISARGFNTDLANKMLVMIDGRTVYTPLFSGVFWDRQDYLLEDIDRIEVISGPGGTLWGSNAVNGVINIITKSSDKTQGLYAEAGAGNQLRAVGGLRYGGRINDDVSFRVYGKYFDRDAIAFPDGEDALDSWNMGQGGFRMDATPGEKNTWSLQGDYYNGREDIATGGVSAISGLNVLGRWKHIISDKSDFAFQLYYDRTNLDMPVPPTQTEIGPAAPAGRFGDNLDTYDIDFQHRFSPGTRHQLVWGLGYRLTHDVVNNAPALAFAPPVLDRNLVSFFFQEQATISEKLSATVGTKIEHNDYTKVEIEPSARLHFLLNSSQSLWAAVSRAVRIPSRVDRHIRLPTPNFAPIGVDNLLVGGEAFDSETVIAYEAGYRMQTGKSVSGSISTYYNVYDKIRSTSASLGIFPLYYDNNLEGETYGAEVTLAWQVLDWWRLRAGYNLFQHDIRIKEGKSDFNNALNENADPQNRITIHSFMNLSDNFTFDARLRHVGSFVYNVAGTPDRVPAYTELEARLAWLPNEHFELSVTGQNLLHAQHLEYVISSPNPRAEVKRSVYLKLAYRF